jgi:hypothetical protein
MSNSYTFRMLALSLIAAIGFNLTFAAGNTASDKLSKIAWMQGAWKASVDGDYLDEYWSPPHADSMLGMFRWVKKDKLWMSEMLSIVTEGENIVLRVKHFDRSMVGWEEKDKPLVLPLVKQSTEESIFETQDQTGEKSEAVRLSYRKTGPDTMDIILEVKGKEAERRNEFHFKRLG